MFGVPERQADALIEELLTSWIEPRAWLMFGTDLSLLAALDQYWRPRIDITVALLPGLGELERDVALDVIAMEGHRPDAAVWLHGPISECEGPADVVRASILLDAAEASRLQGTALCESLRRLP